LTPVDRLYFFIVNTGDSHEETFRSSACIAVRAEPWGVRGEITKGAAAAAASHHQVTQLGAEGPTQVGSSGSIWPKLEGYLSRGRSLRDG
jgi:hypothetical protein